MPMKSGKVSLSTAAFSIGLLLDVYGVRNEGVHVDGTADREQGTYAALPDLLYQ
jgi:hypothetical protein